MVLLVKLCTAEIVYWCQYLLLYIYFAQCVELGKNWFFFFRRIFLLLILGFGLSIK
jgi:hypothetical protein